MHETPYLLEKGGLFYRIFFATTVTASFSLCRCHVSTVRTISHLGNIFLTVFLAFRPIFLPFFPGSTRSFGCTLL